jgi:hypothetical protein
MAVRDPDTEWVRVQTCRRMDIAARMYEDAVSLVLHLVLPDCLRQKSMHACTIYPRKRPTAQCYDVIEG